MVNYTYSRNNAANFNTAPPTVARSASGSVYAIEDTGFTTPLNVVLVIGGATVTTISTDSLGLFPDFTVAGRTSVVWKQTGSSFATVLTTTDPVPGPQGAPGATGPAGPAGPAGAVASVIGRTGAVTGAQIAADPALTATYVPLASRGAASGVASLDSGSKVPMAQIPDLSGIYIPIATGNNPGLHVNTPSPTYGAWFTFGNAPGSMGFAGNGSPPEAWAPWVVYQRFGDWSGGSNTPVTKTTQAAAILASYYGPCADDAAEAFSSFVALKNTGTAFAHTKPTVAIEAIAQIEGNNTAMGGESAPFIGNGSRVNILGGSHVAVSANYKATTNSTGGPTFGTSDKHAAFYQPLHAAANGGTFTKAYGVYVCDPINSEDGYTIGSSGYTGQAWILANGGSDSSTSFAFFQAPSTANLTTMTLRAATGQSKSILQAVDSGGTTRFQVSFAGSVNQTSQSYNWQNSSQVSQVVIAGNSSNGTITLAGGVNFILDTTTGSKIGTVGGAGGQKIGFFGATPVIQQLLATGASHTVDDIITTLQTLGLVRQS